MARASLDGTWPDCGCPLSLVSKDACKIDLAWGPHVCLVSRDESRKHYIFEGETYMEASQAPEDSPLGVWIADRLRDGRLFVAKPPIRPPLPPAPWRFEEPPLLSAGLKPGWQYWEATDDALTFDNDFTTSEMYDSMLDDFFEMFQIEGHQKKLMMESAEAWILACGTPGPNVKVRFKFPIKNDRCFVTSDNAFFAMMVQVTRSRSMSNTLDKWLAILELGGRVKHMRRLLDIRIDSKVRMGGCGHVFSFI